MNNFKIMIQEDEESDVEELSYDYFQFSDSQPHVKIDDLHGPLYLIKISGAIKNANDLLTLALIVNTIRMNAKVGEMTFTCYYLLGARMDRRVKNQPHTLKVIANILDSLNFDSIIIFDLHNRDSSALFDTKIIHANFDLNRLVDRLPIPFICEAIICPDKGSAAKYDVNKTVTIGEDDHKNNTCTTVTLREEIPIVSFNKKRDTGGKISSMEMIDHSVDLVNKYVLIVDDICDGGATFIKVAEILKEKYEGVVVDLFVTHGIFSKGFPLNNINHIYTTNSYCLEKSNDYLTVINLT